MAKSSKPVIRYYLEVQHHSGKWESFTVTGRGYKKLIFENRDAWKNVRVIEETITRKIIASMAKPPVSQAK